MKKSQSGPLLILSLLFLTWLFSLYISAGQHYCNWYQAYLDEAINGTVTSKSTPWPRKSFSRDTIILLDGHTLLYLHDGKQMRHLYAIVDTNDMAWKRSGSDTLFLYRNHQLLEFFKITSNCKE